MGERRAAPVIFGEDGDHNWACFKAHQAAGFAVKGLLYGAGRPARGRSVSKLLEAAEPRRGARGMKLI